MRTTMIALAAVAGLSGCGWSTTWFPTALDAGNDACDALDGLAGLIDAGAIIIGPDAYEAVKDIREDRALACAELRRLDAEVPTVPTLIGEAEE